MLESCGPSSWYFPVVDRRLYSASQSNGARDNSNSMRSPALLLAAGVVVLCAAILASEDSGGGGTFYPTCRPGKVPHNLCPEIPQPYRQVNYTGNSCVWSSTISMFRAIGDHKNAEKMRRNYRGPCGPQRLNSALRQMGVPYAYTVDGDEKLLLWALKHNRPVGIEYGGNHAQLLVGKQNGYALILNNYSNGTEIHKVEWNEFRSNWRRRYNGWAWVVLPKGVVPPPEVPFSRGV
jgi:hypothetical protein